MAVLENNLFDKIIDIGKRAIQLLKEGNLDDFFKLSEDAWSLFPYPKENWNQAYNFSKMIFKHSVENNEMNQAKKWLDRMIGNNNSLHLFDIDVDFNIGKYHFENDDYQQALEKWRYVVSEADFRYFERENPKYLDFYKNPEKYTEK